VVADSVADAVDHIEQTGSIALVRPPGAPGLVRSAARAPSRASMRPRRRCRGERGPGPHPRQRAHGGPATWLII